MGGRCVNGCRATSTTIQVRRHQLRPPLSPSQAATWNCCSSATSLTGTWILAGATVLPGSRLGVPATTVPGTWLTFWEGTPTSLWGSSPHASTSATASRLRLSPRGCGGCTAPGSKSPSWPSKVREGPLCWPWAAALLRDYEPDWESGEKPKGWGEGAFQFTFGEQNYQLELEKKNWWLRHKALGKMNMKKGAGISFFPLDLRPELSNHAPPPPPLLKIIFIAGILLWKTMKKLSKLGRGCMKTPFACPDSFDASFW